MRAAGLGTAAALTTLLACAPVAAAAAPHTGSAHTGGVHRVFTLTGQLVKQSRFDVEPAGPSQGDWTAFRSDLLDKNDNKVGNTGGTCTTTWAEEGGEEDCAVTYSLPGGDLTVQGKVTGFITNPLTAFDNAITGGTGEFRTARGTVHAGAVENGKRRFTIDLYY